MGCLPPALHDPISERWAIAAALVHLTCDAEALEFYHGTRQLLPAMLKETRAEDFLGELERETWQVVEELAQRDGPGGVSQLTVGHELVKRGVKGAEIAKLSEWIAELPTPLLGIHAASLVHEAAERRRRMQRLQEEARALARGEDAPHIATRNRYARLI
jgi:hypothetical protein